jgi:hypothetical protein
LEAVRSAIPDHAISEVEIGFPLAADLLGIYRHRYQSIDEFRESRYGWDIFFSVLENRQGRIGLVGINCAGWRFVILVSEDLKTALACLRRPPD